MHNNTKHVNIRPQMNAHIRQLSYIGMIDGVYQTYNMKHYGVTDSISNLDKNDQIVANVLVLWPGCNNYKMW